MEAKYANEEFTAALIEMFQSKSEDDINLAAQIFDNLLDDELNFNGFIESFDSINDRDKYKTIESNPLSDKKYAVNKNYLRFCLEHTAWCVRQEQFNK